MENASLADMKEVDWFMSLVVPLGVRWTDEKKRESSWEPCHMGQLAQGLTSKSCLRDLPADTDRVHGHMTIDKGRDYVW